MKKYVVLKYFTDLQDNSFAYHEGDTFPREGLTVSEERLAELSSNNNKRGIPLIEEMADAEEKVAVEAEPVEEEKRPTKKSSKKEKGK